MTGRKEHGTIETVTLLVSKTFTITETGARDSLGKVELILVPVVHETENKV
jgi:hypothetical protein